MDPSQPLSKLKFVRPTADRSEEEVGEGSPSIEGLFKTHLTLVGNLQTRLKSDSGELSTRDFKDLIAATTSALGLAHRTDELQRTIDTYKLFASTVLEFLRARGDQVGEDLVEELRNVSRTIGTEESFQEVERSV